MNEMPRNARADETIPQGSTVPSESTEIRENRRHCWSDLPERGVGVAQSEAALLQQTDLRKFHRSIQTVLTRSFFLFFPPPVAYTTQR